MKLSRTLAIWGVVCLGAVSQAQFPQTTKSIPFTQLQSGQYSNAKSRTLLEFSDERSFDQYWSKTFDDPRGTAPQNVNWGAEKVVVLHLGERQTGGYRFFISGIEQTLNNRIIIRTVEQTPVPGSFVDQSVTSPWIIIKVPYMLRNFTMSVSKRDRFNGNLIVGPGVVNGGGGTCSCNGNCSCGCGCGG